MILKCIRSGCQSGADISGLISAKKNDLQYMGLIPKGFKTLDGPRPEYAELYNVVEHRSDKYPPRTFENVEKSDGTIRFATDFNSAGEKCTLKAISQYDKPYLDVYIKNTSIFHTFQNEHPSIAAEWIINNNIQILNVAGNSEKTSKGIQKWVERYLDCMIKVLKDRDYHDNLCC